MHAITQVSKPRFGAFAPHLFDARIIVVARDALTRHGHPVLVAGVNERDVGFRRAVLEVVELLAVRVGEEEEVWAGALGDGHGAADGLLGGVVLVDGLVGLWDGMSWLGVAFDLRLRLDGKYPGYRS